MAKITLIIEAFGRSVTKSVSFTKIRAGELFDDMIEFQYTDLVDNGAGGKRQRTRAEVADYYGDRVLIGMHGLAKRLEGMRLAKTAPKGRDLKGNTD